jgi:TRAP-type C4-dicarboxylate transport system substrate-binding protein
MRNVDRKRAVAMVAATVSMAGVFVAASGIAPAAAEEKLQPMQIRIASDFTPPPHPAGIAEIYFQEELPKAIPGSSLRIFTAGSLYNIPEAVEAMGDGTLEMTWGQFGKTAQIDPDMLLVDGPMLLTTPGAMNQLDSFDTYKFLVKRMEKAHGVKIYGSSHLSMYVGVGAGTRLLKPADFVGKKIRSTGPAENVALESWGASAVTMAFGDVPPALETKVINGLVTSLGGFVSTKDQAPYFTIAGINGISGDYYWLGASEKWLSRYNKRTQDALQKLIVEKVIPFAKAINWCNDKRVIDKYGTKDPSKPGIYILTSAEQEAFSEKLGDATTKWVKSKTPKDAHKWADKFVEQAKAASKAHPLGTSALEKTDCSKYQSWFARFVKKK